MNFKRIGRVLVCLLLVFCLIVNVSPIRTEAVSLSVMGTAVSVVAWDILAAAFIGCGIAAAADRTDFDAVVDAAEDYYKSVGVIDGNGAIDVYSIQNAGFDYGVPVDYIQSVFDYAYDTEVVTAGSFTSLTIGGDMTVSGTIHATYDYTSSDPFYPVYLHYEGANENWYGELYFVWYTSSRPLTFTCNDRSKVSDIRNGSDGFYYCFVASCNGSKAGQSMDWYPGKFVSLYEGISDICDLVGHQSELDVTTGRNLSLSEVALAGSTIEAGYSDWYSRSVTIQDENGDDIQVVPIGSASTGTVAGTYTQGDVWTGSAPIIYVIDNSTTGGSGTEPTEPDTGGGTTVPMDPVTPTLLERLFGNVQEKLDLTYVSIQEIPELLKEFMVDVKTGFLELPGKFAEWFTKLQETLEKLLSGQLRLSDLLTGLVEPVKTAVKDALSSMFAPSETFIQMKVETLISKYPFAETFLALGPNLKTFFLNLGAQPPIIYINLGAAAGSYYLGGKEVFLDLTWYEQYKGTVDSILGGFIWLWLAWRVFLSLPGLIQGASGFWGPVNDHPDASFGTVLPRLNSGNGSRLLGTNEHHSKGSGGKHYVKHDGS